MYKIIAGLLAVLFISNSYAQMPSRKAMIGQALKDYGNVAGGVYLNQRCKFLSPDDTVKFEQNLKVITSALAVDLGNNKILGIIDKGAKSVAESEKYADCGKKIDSIINPTFTHSNNWAKEINKIQSFQTGTQEKS